MAISTQNLFIYLFIAHYEANPRNMAIPHLESMNKKKNGHWGPVIFNKATHTHKVKIKYISVHFAKCTHKYLRTVRRLSQIAL